MKKKLFIFLIIIILLITAVVFFLKYRGLIGGEKNGPPDKFEPSAPSVKIQSFGVSGTVTHLDMEKKELAVETDKGEIILDVTSAPPQSVYMIESEKRINKNVSDLQNGSQIQVRYLDNGTRKVPLVILIEKL